MARQIISTGSAPNDGTGDTLLQGATKINQNFSEIYASFGNGTNLTPIVAGPQGVQGPQGAIGPQGSQGVTGAQGAIGPQGITGLTGPQGSQGSSGSQGYVGPQGAQGDLGPRGPQGVQGPQGYGPQGAQGIVGSQGDQGSIGPQGITGLTGPQGSQGSSGSQGAVGAQGAQGDLGPTGPQGSQGVTGAQGVIGPQGAQGAQGDLGPTGPQGSQGVTGAQGVIGPQGTQGPSYWIQNEVGIHTLTNVGIGTTNPTNTLTVGGGTSTRDLYVTGVSTIPTLRGNVTLTGTLTADGLALGDNETAIFGDSDLVIKSDGNKGVISGGLLKENYLIIQNPVNSNYIAKFQPVTGDGSDNVELYHSGSKKFETLGAGVTVTGTTFTNQLSVSGVSTFTGIATFKGNSTVTELGNTSYDGIRFLGGASNFALIQSDSLGNLVINSQSTTNRNIELNGQHRFYANTGNVELNLSDIGTTKVGSAITFTASTGNIYATSVRVGINTSQGVILTSPNGTKYQLFVENDGTLKTVAV